MSDIHEKVSEAIENAEPEEGGGDKKHSKLNTLVAALVAVAATFLALCNVKAGNVVQAMGKVQVEIVDTWSFFQAKSTKQNMTEASLDQLSFLRNAQAFTEEQRAAMDKQLEGYRAKVVRYEHEKDELKAKVDALQKDYERLNEKDDQFDISEALLSVAIALFGITALTQKRFMLWVAMGFMGFGLVVGLSGFFGWNVRPEVIAKVLGA